jgi:hypothetical protein
MEMEKNKIFFSNRRSVFFFNRTTINLFETVTHHRFLFFFMPQPHTNHSRERFKKKPLEKKKNPCFFLFVAKQKKRKGSSVFFLMNDSDPYGASFR